MTVGAIMSMDAAKVCDVAFREKRCVCGFADGSSC